MCCCLLSQHSHLVSVFRRRHCQRGALVFTMSECDAITTDHLFAIFIEKSVMTDVTIKISDLTRERTLHFESIPSAIALRCSYSIELAFLSFAQTHMNQKSTFGLYNRHKDGALLVGFVVIGAVDRSFPRLQIHTCNAQRWFNLITLLFANMCSVTFGVTLNSSIVTTW